jgi:hypothetical protein
MIKFRELLINFVGEEGLIEAFMVVYQLKNSEVKFIKRLLPQYLINLIL